jgi:hypothetical protein
MQITIDSSLTAMCCYDTIMTNQREDSIPPMG